MSDRASLRKTLLASAEADLVKNIDPRDPDADFMRNLAREMAIKLVDGYLSHVERASAALFRPGATTVTPGDFKRAIEGRLADDPGRASGALPRTAEECAK